MLYFDCLLTGWLLAITLRFNSLACLRGGQQNITMTDNHKSSHKTQGNKQWQSHKHFIIALISNYMTHTDAKSYRTIKKARVYVRERKKKSKKKKQEFMNKCASTWLYKYVHSQEIVIRVYLNGKNGNFVDFQQCLTAFCMASSCG